MVAGRGRPTGLVVGEQEQEILGEEHARGYAGLATGIQWPRPSVQTLRTRGTSEASPLTAERVVGVGVWLRRRLGPWLARSR